MEFQIKQTRAADAAFLPTVERSAGEVFRTIPSLSWIADDDDRSVNAHLATLNPVHPGSRQMPLTARWVS